MTTTGPRTDRYAFAQSLARRAGALASDYFGDRERLTVELKGPQDFVSHADRDVEALLRREVAAAYPGDAFLGEETAASFTGPLNRCWVVDPIDGTHNFVRGIPIWATLLAVERGGELVAAVVSAPALGQRWTAVRGRGAGLRVDGRERAIQVSKVTHLEEAQILFGTLRSIDAGGYGAGLRRVLDHAWRDRGLGDFWGYMLVAQGSAEAMMEVGPTLWDLAAPALIVAEAGGRMTNIEGELGYGGPTALATNGHLHGELVALLREARSGEPA